MDTTTSLQLRASPLLWKIFCAVHIVAASLVLIYPTILLIKVLALVLIAISAAGAFCYIKNLANVTQLQFSDEQNFVWWKGRKETCDIVGNPFVSHFLVILSVRITGYGVPRDKKINAILLPDSATADELRKVRVYLLTEFSSIPR